MPSQSIAKVRIRLRLQLVLFLTTIMTMASCTTLLPPAEVTTTLISPTVGETGFGTVLVISVAGDYNQRARFEQRASSILIENGIDASPYYAVVGRRPLVTRNNINTAIQNRRFDAVLFVRLQGQVLSDAATGRTTGEEFQLFLYDYDEFNQPTALPDTASISFVGEAYQSSGETRVWSVDSLSAEHRTSAIALTIQTIGIAQQFVADGLAGN